jgi:hypothetical protein
MKPQFFEGGKSVQAVGPEDFEPSEVAAEFTEPEAQTWAIRRAALRYVTQVDNRSFAEIAAELGCRKQAIGKAHIEILKAAKLDGVYLRAAARLAAKRKVAA